MELGVEGQADFNSENIEVHNQEHCVEVILPALSVVVLAPKRVYGVPKK